MFESVEAHLLSCVPLEELESEIFLGNWFKKEANKNSIPLFVFRDQENMEGKRCSLYGLDWLLEQRSERVVLFFPSLILCFTLGDLCVFSLYLGFHTPKSLSMMLILPMKEKNKLRSIVCGTLLPNDDS